MKKIPSVNDVIPFGPYEWQVLKKEGPKMLLLAKDIIAFRPFHDKYEPVNWEKSALRAWLNGPFLEPFNETQRRAMFETELVTRAQDYPMNDDGVSTVDTVFLLSVGEAKTRQEKEEDKPKEKEKAKDKTLGNKELLKLIKEGEAKTTGIKTALERLKQVLNALNQAEEVNAVAKDAEVRDRLSKAREALAILVNAEIRNAEDPDRDKTARGTIKKMIGRAKEILLEILNVEIAKETMDAEIIHALHSELRGLRVDLKALTDAKDNLRCPEVRDAIGKVREILDWREYLNESLIQDPEDRVAKPTEEAKEAGIWTSQDGTADWWLRSQGQNAFDAANVFYSNYINVVGYYAGGDNPLLIYGGTKVPNACGVRPAVWVDAGRWARMKN